MLDIVRTSVRNCKRPSVPEFRQHGDMDRPEGWNKTGGIGERVRLWRDHRGWSLQELADRAGMPKTTLADLERGDTKKGTYLGDIARALGLRLTYVTTGRGHPEGSDESDEAIWPFPDISPERVRSLKRFERHFLETRLREALEEIEAERRKDRSA